MKDLTNGILLSVRLARCSRRLRTAARARAWLVAASLTYRDVLATPLHVLGRVSGQPGTYLALDSPDRRLMSR